MIDVIKNIGQKFDLLCEKGNVKDIQIAIDEALKMLRDMKFDTYNQAILNYYLAVAYGDIINLSYNRKIEIGINDKLYEKEIIHYRKAFLLLDNLNNKDDEYKAIYAMVLTNLANSFNSIGRFVEAIEYWNKALSIIPNFTMALGNKGICLYYYSKTIYDNGHKYIFLYESYRNIKKALNSRVSQESFEAFTEYANTIKSYFDNDFLENKLELRNYELGQTDEEIKYRKWCLNSRLFLNPLNDIIKENLVAHDILHTPNMITSIDTSPKYQGFYNQLKQEYVSARYIYYESINIPRHHFSDNEVLMFNTLDYPKYGLNLEKLKCSFRMCYALLDKIAYFINDYFNIGIEERDVNYRSLWYSEKKGKNGYKYKNDLKKIMIERYNWSLQGLYWLYKDFYDNKSGITEFLSPDARILDVLRNHMEHKYLKIHEMYNYENMTDDLFKDELAFSISYFDLEKKTYRLMKIIRAALIYLSLSINEEEKHKEKERGKGFKTCPAYLTEYLDEWKL
ncbi:LA2681 family HEPN domain-containing protein [Clostridium aciditolerans]|uniref:LA2681-like HEPN domain-containing protein n=1 Tax=Clostridium aciditolerans TaxID=339861 RepID=A0A934M5T9_9CLOT|nr:LA2681 family HEPN domain-containing protein [Clostridium aciditolerans]MBI6875622.1 hypothetical protein [Clostridium aciditolerans]